MILSTKKKIPHEKRSPAQEKQNPAPSVNALPLLITATRFRKATSESSQHESGSKEDDSQDQKTNPPDSDACTTWLGLTCSHSCAALLNVIAEGICVIKAWRVAGRFPLLAQAWDG